MKQNFCQPNEKNGVIYPLIEIVEHMFEIDAVLSYELKSDGTIILRKDQQGSVIVLDEIKRKSYALKEDLRSFLKGYIYSNMGFYGLPRFLNSGLLDKSDFNALINEITDELEKELIKKSEKSVLINFLKESGLNPKLEKDSLTNWTAPCPNAIGKHSIMVSSKSEQWGCGYCKRKGKLEELKSWLVEIENRKT